MTQTTRLYCNLMEEIKPRLAVINGVLTGVCGPMPKRIAQEFCYLQLRLICELIALACLVAHGDVMGTRTAGIRKRYAADWIMEMLQELHPNFYPQPITHRVERQRQESVPAHHRHELIKSEYLTRNDLIQLYRDCGKLLHRGTVEDILSRHERSVDFERVRQWTNKIVILLKDHLIQLIDPKLLYLVTMDGPSGKVQIASAHWTNKP